MKALRNTTLALTALVGCLFLLFAPQLVNAQGMDVEARHLRGRGDSLFVEFWIRATGPGVKFGNANFSALVSEGCLNMAAKQIVPGFRWAPLNTTGPGNPYSNLTVGGTDRVTVTMLQTNPTVAPPDVPTTFTRLIRVYVPVTSCNCTDSLQIVTSGVITYWNSNPLGPFSPVTPLNRTTGFPAFLALNPLQFAGTFPQDRCYNDLIGIRSNRTGNWSVLPANRGTFVSSNSNVDSITYLFNGTYPTALDSITFTQTDLGPNACTRSVKVALRPKPIANLATSSDTICEGGTLNKSITLVGNPPFTVTYDSASVIGKTRTFTTAGVNNWTLYTDQIDPPPSPTEYTLQVTNVTDNTVGACAGQVLGGGNVELVAKQQFRARFSAENDTVTYCVSEAVSLEYFVTGDGPSDSVDIRVLVPGVGIDSTFRGVSGGTGQVDFTYSFAAGSYLVYFETTTTDFGCVDTTNSGLILRILPQPTASFLASPNTVCSADSVEINLNIVSLGAPLGQPRFTATINANGSVAGTVSGLRVGANNFKISPPDNAGGIYLIGGPNLIEVGSVADDTTGCSITYTSGLAPSYTLTVNRTPQGNLFTALQPAYCAGDTIDFNLSLIDSTGLSAVRLFRADIGLNAIVPVTPLGGVNFRLRVVAPAVLGVLSNDYIVDSIFATAGCAVDVNLPASVTLNPQLNATLAYSPPGNDSVCAGTNFFFETTLTPAIAGPHTFIYKTSWGTRLSLSTPSTSFSTSVVAPMIAGPQFVYLDSLVSVDGCLSRNVDTLTFIVNTPPVATISMPAAFCIGDTALATVTFTSGIPPFSVSVSIDGNTPLTFNNLAGPTAVVGFGNAPAAGTFQFVIAQVTDGNGCTSFNLDTTTVLVNAKPVVTNQVDTFEYCSSSIPTFTMNVTGVGSTYTIYFSRLGDGFVPLDSVNNYTSGSPLPFTSDIAIYTTYEILAVRDELTGCVVDSSAFDFTLTLFEVPNPVVNLISGPSGSFCAGDPISTPITFESFSNSDAKVFFNLPGGVLDSVIVPAFQTVDAFPALPNTPGSYSYNIASVVSFGYPIQCIGSGTGSFVYDVVSPPSISDFSQNATSFCAGDSIVYSITIINGPANFNLEIGAGPLIVPFNNFSGSTTFSYGITSTDSSSGFVNAQLNGLVGSLPPFCFNPTPASLGAVVNPSPSVTPRAAIYSYCEGDPAPNDTAFIAGAGPFVLFFTRNGTAITQVQVPGYVSGDPITSFSGDLGFLPTVYTLDSVLDQGTGCLLKTGISFTTTYNNVVRPTLSILNGFMGDFCVGSPTLPTLDVQNTSVQTAEFVYLDPGTGFTQVVQIPGLSTGNFPLTPPVTPGPYNVGVVAVTSFGAPITCAGFFSGSATFNMAAPPSVASFTTLTSGPYCPGDSIEYQLTIANGPADFSVSVGLGPQNYAFSNTSSATFKYGVTVSDGQNGNVLAEVSALNGTSAPFCFNPTTTQLNTAVNIRPVLLASGSQTICEGDPENPTFISVFNGVGPYNLVFYTDTSGGNTDSSFAVSGFNGNTTLLLPGAPGFSINYTLKSIFDIGGGCSNLNPGTDVSYDITINATPVVGFQQDTVIVCQGGTGFFNYVFENFTPGATNVLVDIRDLDAVPLPFDYTNLNFLPGITATSLPYTNIPGTYRFVITQAASNPAGCQAFPTDTLRVIVQPTPAGTFDIVESSVCEASDFTLSFTATSPNYPVTARIARGAPFNDKISVVALGPGPFNLNQNISSFFGKVVYTVDSLYGPNGCVADVDIRDSIIIRVRPSVNDFSTTLAVCQGESFPRIDVNTSGAGSPINLEFSVSVNGVVTNPNYIVTLLNPGLDSLNNFVASNPGDTTVYTLINVVDASGCVAPTIPPAVVTLIRYTAPVGEISGGITRCQDGTQVSFTVSNTGSDTTTFYYSGLTPGSITLNPFESQQVFLPEPAPNTYILGLDSAVTSKGCRNLVGGLTGSATITILEAPQLAFNGTNSAVCTGGILELYVDLTATTSLPVSISIGRSLVGLGPDTTISLTTSGLQTIQLPVPPTATGGNLFINNIQGSNGCFAIPSSTGSQPIVVNPAPVGSVTEDTVIACQNGIGTVDLTFTNSTPSSESVELIISELNGGPVFGPSFFGFGPTTIPFPHPSTPGTYSYVLSSIRTLVGNCTLNNVDTFSVVVRPAPAATLNITTNNGCVGQPFTVELVVTAGTFPMQVFIDRPAEFGTDTTIVVNTLGLVNFQQSLPLYTGLLTFSIDSIADAGGFCSATNTGSDFIEILETPQVAMSLVAGAELCPNDANGIQVDFTNSTSTDALITFFDPVTNANQNLVVLGNSSSPYVIGNTLGAGTYNFSFVTVTSNGYDVTCNGSGSGVAGFVVYPAPSVTGFQVTTPGTYCQNSLVNLSGTVVDGPADVTFTFDDGTANLTLTNLNGPFDFDYLVTGAGASSGTVVVNVLEATRTNTPNCTQASTQTATITTALLPNVTFGGSVIVCEGTAVPQAPLFAFSGSTPFNINVTADTVGGGSASFLVTGAVPGPSSLNLPGAIGKTVKYSYNSVQDANGCVLVPTMPDTFTVTINAAPTGSATGGVNICIGTGAFFTVDLTNPTVNNLEFHYTSSFGDTLVTVPANSSQNFSQFVTVAGTYTFTLDSVRNPATGCATAIGTTVSSTYYANPTVNSLSSSSLAYCPGSLITINYDVVAAAYPVNITFNRTNMNDTSIVVGSQFGSFSYIAPSTVTQTTVNVPIFSLVDGNGCTLTAPTPFATYSLNPQPSAVLNTVSATVCQGQPEPGTSLTITRGVGTNFTAYVNVDTLGSPNPDGSFIIPGLALGGNPLSSLNFPGVVSRTLVYTITQIEDNGTGCFSAGPIGGSYTITVNPQASGTIAGGGPDTCFNGGFNLNYTITNTSTSDAVFHYSGSDVGFISVNAGQTANLSYSVSAPGNYTIQLDSAVTLNGCVSTNVSGLVSQTVLGNPSVVALTLDQASYCPGQLVTVTYGFNSGSSPLAVRFKRTNMADTTLLGVGTGGNFSFLAPDFGSAVAFVIQADSLSNAAGCAALPAGLTTTSTATFNSLPTVSFSGVVNRCVTDPTVSLPVNFSNSLSNSFSLLLEADTVGFTAGTIFYNNLTASATIGGVDGAVGRTVIYRVLSVTDDVTGCVNTNPNPSTYQVTVNPLPTGVMAGGGAPVCFFGGASLTFTFQNTGLSDARFYYSGSFTGNALVPSGQTHIEQPLVTIPGLYTINLDSIVDVGTGCKNIGPFTPISQQFNQQPTVSNINASPFDNCIGDLVTINYDVPTGTFPVDLTFEVDGIAPIPTTANGSTGNSFSFVLPAVTPGFKNINVISGTDINGCSLASAPTPSSLRVRTQPVVSFALDTSICQGVPGVSATFTFPQSDLGGPFNVVLRVDSLIGGDDTILVSGITDGQQVFLNGSVGNTLEYTVISVTELGGCVNNAPNASLARIFTRINPAGTLSFVNPQDTLVCAGSTLNFILGTAKAANHDYILDTDFGGFNGSFNGIDATLNLTVPTVPGTYSIRLANLFDGFCGVTNQDTLTFRVESPDLILVPAADTITVSTGTSFNFIATRNVDWFLYNGSGPVAFGAGPSALSTFNNSSGAVRIDTVVAQSPSGCADTVIVRVESNYNLRVNALLFGAADTSLANPNMNTSADSMGTILNAIYNGNTGIGDTTGFVQAGLTMAPGFNPPAGAVDVIKLFVRSTPAGANVDSALAWLMQDGTIRDFQTGTADFASFSSLPGGGPYHVLVYHRNHLPVMSVNTYTLVTTTVGIPTADLTVPGNITGGVGFTGGAFAAKGKALLFPGNVVNYSWNLYEVNALDLYFDYASFTVPTPGTYSPYDVNLDGQRNTGDNTVIQFSNDQLYNTKVPNP